MRPSRHRNRSPAAAPEPKSDPDAIDRHILSELYANGRIQNSDLAKRVGLTASPCLRRIQMLEAKGYIRGYHAELDSRRLGFAVAGFVFVELASQSRAEIRRFEDRVRTWPDVRECSALSGEVDFLLKCVARDALSFEAFVQGTIAQAPGVKTAKTAIIVHALKKPVDLSPKR
ncbi:MAG: Lrp/AsnC family transcriptional regulator, partial [Rhizomicrobium sp.]